ncbi:hypothetical protein U0070_000788 [Myodes glareolus]|uniref:Uncharacterized protein n=1 Tax=Myodes glareolus TaxID=447135 RepID=A0AAW0I5P1_MYOGA
MASIRLRLHPLQMGANWASPDATDSEVWSALPRLPPRKRAHFADRPVDLSVKNLNGKSHSMMVNSHSKLISAEGSSNKREEELQKTLRRLLDLEREYKKNSLLLKRSIIIKAEKNLLSAVPVTIVRYSRVVGDTGIPKEEGNLEDSADAKTADTAPARDSALKHGDQGEGLAWVYAKEKLITCGPQRKVS